MSIQDAMQTLQRAVELQRLGQLEDAEGLCWDVLMEHPDQPQALYIQGMIHEARREYDRALDCVTKAIGVDDKPAEFHFFQGVLFLRLNRQEEALAAFQRAAEIKPDDASAFFQIGTILVRLGRFGKACDAYRRVIALLPSEPWPYVGLGDAQRSMGFHDEALASYQTAIDLNPNHAPAYCNRGNVFKDRYELGEAETCYRKALEIQPDLPMAHANLAWILELRNEIDEAKSHADQALSRQPGNRIANIVMAKLERRAGGHERALSRLDQLLAGPMSDSLSAFTQSERGTVLDRMGRHDEAFEAFQRAQDFFARMAQQSQGYNPALIYESIARWRSWIEPSKMADWPKSFDDVGPEKPIFLVGMHRSGSTLTEQILGAHPDLVTTGEAPLINDLARELQNSSGESLPDAMERIDDATVMRLRSRYLEMVDARLGAGERGERRIVDKNLFNLTQLPFIQRLFPDAKIVVLIRDPRDVVLSCFMQAFQVNSATVHYYDISSAAGLYDAVMDLWLHEKDALDLAVCELRYEDLVTDFDGTARGLVDFLELPWTDELKSYAERVEGRTIRTASYAAVSEPLSKSAIGRWRHYEKHIAPAMGLLRRYIETFGYDGAPGRQD